MIKKCNVTRYLNFWVVSARDNENVRMVKVGGEGKRVGKERKGKESLFTAWSTNKTSVRCGEQNFQ